jgi:4-hydroxy-2-oxoglutarate aldolase
MVLTAIFPPMATPLRDDRVDLEAIGSNIRKWVEAGVGGVVALGSNGEAPLLEDDESDRVIAAARDALPRDRTLIAGTGRESTNATIAATARAASRGADAVLVRTPSYFKGRMTPDAFERHYTAVAEAATVPVILYNYPAVTGVNLQADTVGRLSEHPNIAGIKETGSDTAQVAAYVAASRETFAVLAGSMPTFYPSLCVGAVGAILALACVAPRVCIRIFEDARAGRHAEARAAQRQATPLARMMTATHGVPGLKAAMELTGYSAGLPRGPLTPAPAAAVAEIRAEIERLRRICPF